MTAPKEPLEPVVLDADGSVVYDPTRESGYERHAELKAAPPLAFGRLPKILVGGAFALLLVLGLTVAGIALGILLLTLIVRAIFSPKRR